jgi:hypothetical protein
VALEMPRWPRRRPPMHWDKCHALASSLALLALSCGQGTVISSSRRWGPSQRSRARACARENEVQVRDDGPPGSRCHDLIEREGWSSGVRHRSVKESALWVLCRHPSLRKGGNNMKISLGRRGADAASRTGLPAAHLPSALRGPVGDTPPASGASAFATSSPGPPARRSSAWECCLSETSPHPGAAPGCRAVGVRARNRLPDLVQLHALAATAEGDLMRRRGPTRRNWPKAAVAL